MAAKKKVTSVVLSEPTVSSESIHLLSIDYGREDINNIARKVNEIIIHLNK